MTTDIDIYNSMKYDLADELSPRQFERVNDVFMEIRLLEDAGLITERFCMACAKRERELKTNLEHIGL